MHLKYRRSLMNRSRLGNVMVWIVLIVAGLFMSVPLIYAVTASLKPFEEIFLFPPKLYVINPTWDNYTALFSLTGELTVPFSRYLFNSFFIAVATTVIQIIFASMAAYPLAKGDFPGKNIIFNVIVFSLMFVSQVTFMPQYILMAKLQLLNTWWSLLLPTVGSSMGLFLMKQFMEQIPYAIIESARLDGAGEGRIVFSLVFPNVKPAWLTLAIFTFQGMWNTTGSSYLFDEDIKLLPTALAQITQSNATARMGVGMATTVILMIPLILFFILSQSNVVKTMAFAGIKE